MRNLIAEPMRLTAALALALSPIATVPTVAHAQYFGRNKVQYEHLDFRVLPTPHFDLYFYPSESLATTDAARMAERWYQRHNALFAEPFEKNPVIFYADQPDFQQSNVIEEFIGQGTGGVTEGARDRVIMPFTGAYAETDHVLGHELVHVFQYRIVQAMPGGLRGINQIPLWLIEGMAEYLSLGRRDANTAMWLRDALRRNDLPTIRKLNTDPRYFPYRYGQALWAFIGGTWGDEAVARVYRAALQHGWESALKSELHVSDDSLSKAWHAAIRREYAGTAERLAPGTLGRSVAIAEHEGDQNVSPAVSPDGRYLAFYSSRSLFGLDVYVAEIATGRVVKRLTSVTGDRHFDALSFIATAGSWSPDGRKLAFSVYAEGSNEIVVMDVASGRTERRIRPEGIGAINDPAWSPDGTRLAFSGLKGGISDLYLFDLTTGKTEPLTAGRGAEFQPAWSPDGRTLAFVTDRGPEASFEQLSYAPMRLALMDVATREVRLIPRFGPGKEINPQYSPDGAALYFVSDQDGVSDVYRRVLASGEVTRVTRIATGVSGITSLSPAISVARQTGDLLLSVFDRAGFGIRALPSGQAFGTSVAPEATMPAEGLLPPSAAVSTSVVSRSLSTPLEGLPPAAPATVQRYRGGLFTESVRAASVGVTYGGGYGTWLGGGVAIGFTDMLGNRVAQAVIQGQGELEDFGAQVFYLDRTRRWNLGAQAYHVPLAGAYAGYENTVFNVGGQAVAGTIVTQLLQRVFYDDAELLAQYPVSPTRRVEFSAGVQRVSFSARLDSLYIIGSTAVRQTRTSLPSASALTFGIASAAYVADFSYFGFTSPVAGGRYRFQVTPYVGSLNYQTLLADYRRYVFIRPFTVALRGAHVGRYGSDGESVRLEPMFLGQPSLIRGYDAENFQVSECVAKPGAADVCPQFTRLSGSRIAVANLEFRVPLFGTQQFGLFNLPYLPVEVAPFVDAGVAWNNNDGASLRFDQNTAERVPVFSSGVTTRFNLFGALILEVYWVHPYQRPGRGSYVGFQISPGW